MAHSLCAFVSGDLLTVSDKSSNGLYAESLLSLASQSTGKALMSSSGIQLSFLALTRGFVGATCRTVST